MAFTRSETESRGNLVRKKNILKHKHQTKHVLVNSLEMAEHKAKKEGPTMIYRKAPIAKYDT